MYFSLIDFSLRFLWLFAENTWRFTKSNTPHGSLTLFLFIRTLTSFLIFDDIEPWCSHEYLLIAKWRFLKSKKALKQETQALLVKWVRALVLTLLENFVKINAVTNEHGSIYKTNLRKSVGPKITQTVILGGQGFPAIYTDNGLANCLNR